jgi:hypothetical protein
MEIKNVRKVEHNQLRTLCAVGILFEKDQEVIFNKTGIVFPGNQKYNERKKIFSAVKISDCAIGKKLRIVYSDEFGPLGVLCSEENIMQIKVFSE